MSTLQELFSPVMLASRDAAFLALLIGAILLLFLRRLPPAWRHGLWMLVVFRLLLPTLPESAFSWRTWLVPAKNETVLSGPVVFPEGADRFDPDLFQGISVSRTVTSEPLKMARKSEPRWTVWNVLPPLWAAGALLCLAAMIFAWVRFQRRIARLERKHHPKKEKLEAILEELCGALGFARAPGLVVTDAVDGPALAGWLRPRILLPVSTAEELSDSQLRMVLLHELGHLRRCDIAMNWLLGVLQAVHWFNPFVWWAFRRIRVETERATDEWVLRRSGSNSPADYGETLIRLLESSQQRRHAIPGLIGVLESRFSLRSRLVAIRRFRAVRRPWAVAVAVVALLGAAVIGLTQPPKEKPDDVATEERPSVPGKETNFAPFDETSQVRLSVKIWGREGDQPEQLIASPSTVAVLGEWISFHEGHEIGHATGYGLPNLPEKLAEKASGGGTIGEEGEPEEKWDTNAKEVILPPHPTGFERRSLGWTMKLRPERTADGKVRVACVVEQDALGGFVNWGVPIVANLPSGLLGREKSQMVAENRQLLPVFFKGRQEWMFEPEGNQLVGKIVPERSDTGEMTPSERDFVEGFADGLRSADLPKLRIEVTAGPVETTASAAGNAGGRGKVMVMAKFVETDLNLPEWLGTESAILSDPQFQVLIRALSQRKGVDLFTAPSITLADGEAGEVATQREFIYPERYDPPFFVPEPAAGEASIWHEYPVAPATPNPFKIVQTGVELKVKSDIRPDGLIELDLSPRLSEFTEFLNFGAPIRQAKDGKPDGILLSENEIVIPVFDHASHRTKVRVPDGHTVVIGGFVNDRTQYVEDRLPVIGLVTDSRTVVERRRVFVFVTPILMDPAGKPVK